jgi:glycosyltransferase involved in cell wall biosynthesis
MTAEQRLRVLYVAFYFPPAAGGGVQRTLHMVRHLPDLGIDVEVLAPTDAKWLAEDPALLADLPPSLRVHRVPFRGPGTRVLPGERLARANGTAERLRARLAITGRSLLLPDVEAVWLADAVPAGRRLLRSGRFDAIVTTSPPASVAIAGALLARSSGLPWIADWRDAWLGSAELLRAAARDRARAAVLRPLAARTAGRAAAAAAVNEQIAAELRALAPGAEVEVVPNGAAFEDAEGMERHPDRRCTLLYAGYFFGSRSPEPLLRGTAALLARRPDLRADLRLRFLGGLRPRDRHAVAAEGLEDVVEFEPNRPYREALQAERDADALVLLTQARTGRTARSSSRARPGST